MKHFSKITTLLSLFFVLNITSCKNDDDVPADLLTFTADALYYSGDNSNGWVVVWNSEGELLDYKEFTAGTPMKLASAGQVIDNKITIGLVSHFEQDGVENLTVLVFTDISVGQEINRTILDIDEPSVTGPFENFTVTVDNTTFFDKIILSSKYGTSCAINRNGNTTTTGTIDPRSAKNNIMFRNGDVVKHKLLNSVTADEEIILSEEEFTPYEHELTFDIPPSIPVVFLNGYEADQSFESSGYVLDSFFSTVSMDQVTTGYIDGVTKFSTVISLYNPDMAGRRINYQKWGTLPGTINWPDQSQFELVSTNLATFEVATNEPVKYIMASWYGNVPGGPARWEVASPSKSPKIGKLPDEILALFPDKQPSASDFQYVDVCIGLDTYDDFLTRQLTGDRRNGFESMIVSITE